MVGPLCCSFSEGIGRCDVLTPATFELMLLLPFRRCWNEMDCPEGQTKYGDGSACTGGGKPNCDLGFCSNSPNGNMPQCPFPGSDPSNLGWIPSSTSLGKSGQTRAQVASCAGYRTCNNWCWLEMSCPSGQARYGDGSACRGGTGRNCDVSALDPPVTVTTAIHALIPVCSLDFAQTTRMAACPSVHSLNLTQATQAGFLLQQNSAFRGKLVQKFLFVLPKKHATVGAGSRCRAHLDRRVMVTALHALEAANRLAISDFVQIQQMEAWLHALSLKSPLHPSPPQPLMNRKPMLPRLLSLRTLVITRPHSQP